MQTRTAAFLGLIVATVLVCSPLASASSLGDRPAGAEAPFLGVLTISSGCTLSNVNAPVSVSGSTFTFTGQLNGSLIVLCSGATVNGAGHILNYSSHPGGNPQTAITVNDTTGVTIEDVAISNATYGVWANASSRLTIQTMAIQDAVNTPIVVENSADATIQKNLAQNGGGYLAELYNVTGATISNNNGSGTKYGIYADFSYGIVATGNNVSLNPAGYGVGFDYTNDSTATGNLAFGDLYPLWVDDSTNDSFTNNYANDSTDYGLYLYYASDITATDNDLEHAAEYWGDFDDISDVTVQDNDANGSVDGLYAEYSQALTCTDNNVSSSQYGFDLYESVGSTLTDNQAFDTSYAIYLEDTSDSWITGTHAPNAEYGLYSEYDNGTTVVGNDFTNSTYAGVYSTYYSTNLVIDNNDLANSTAYGVYAEEPYGAVSITDNDIAGSLSDGISLEDNYGPLTISGNDIADAADYAIDLEDGYGPVTVTDNHAPNSGDYGIYVEYNNAALTLSGNDFYNSSDYGAYLYETYGTTVISGNNFSASRDYGLYAEYAYGSLIVTGNEFVNTSYAGIYLDEPEGSIQISGNDFARSQEYGIYSDASYGLLNITANDAPHSYVGILDDEPYGPSAILDNNVVDSTHVGIEVEYAYNEGNVELIGNNASGSTGDALYYYEQEYSGETIAGNDFSNSDAVVINASYYLSVIGNDFLNDRWINLTHSELFAFYHNDIDTPGFNGTGSSTETLASWNAPYPIGGNYWTGYAGQDKFSGPQQDIAGSDGIGDTPEPVPHIPAGFDEYPLMHPWSTDAPTLKFSASGLPASLSWSVSVTFPGSTGGTFVGYGTGSAAIVVEPPYGAFGAYDYTVNPVPGFVASPGTGSGTTSAGSSQVSISFAAFLFTATFTASGITSGTSWSLTVNGQTSTATTLSQTVMLANGTYVWSATSAGRTSTTGSVDVDGSGPAVTVVFATTPPLPPGTFALVFTEAGISTGASWSVTIDGNTLSSSSSTIVFALANGTYQYTVATTGSAAPQTPSGSATVAGQATGVSVLFGSATGIGSTKGSSSSGPSWTELYIIAAIAALFAVLAAIGWMRKAGGGASSSTGSGAAGVAGTAPAPWASAPPPTPGGDLPPPPPPGAPPAGPGGWSPPSS